MLFMWGESEVGNGFSRYNDGSRGELTMKVITVSFRECFSLADCEATTCQECYGLITELQNPAESACMDRHKLNCFLASIAPYHHRDTSDACNKKLINDEQEK